VHPDLDPAVLFSLVTVLAAGVALADWRTGRGVAVAAAGLAALSALCVAVEMAARASYADIRVDLLVTIPAVTVTAIAVGIFAVRRPPLAARIAGGALLAVSAPWFAWFAWMMTRSTFEAQALTRIFDQARMLYSEETLRCQANLVTRFGPLGTRDGACSGHLIVTSRQGSGYPFSRVIVNDAGQLYVLFSSQPGIEDNWMLDDGPVTQLKQDADQTLTGDRLAGADRRHVELRPLSAGSCEARIDHYGKSDLLTLKKTELPPCELPGAPPVRFVGAWGAASPEPNNVRRLTQIWLWDIDGMARGLLLTDLATSGMRRDFVFARPLRGMRRAENQWEMKVDGKKSSLPPFLFALSGGQARITGSGGTSRVLEPKEYASHPKITMAPVYDRERFARYFDNVFSNLNVPWTAP
jgi:hypothetical protein